MTFKSKTDKVVRIIVQELLVAAPVESYPPRRKPEYSEATRNHSPSFPGHGAVYQNSLCPGDLSYVKEHQKTVMGPHSYQRCVAHLAVFSRATSRTTSPLSSSPVAE